MKARATKFTDLSECLWFSFGQFIDAVADYHRKQETPGKDPIWKIIHEMASMPLNRANNCTDQYIEETKKAMEKARRQ